MGCIPTYFIYVCNYCFSKLYCAFHWLKFGWFGMEAPFMGKSIKINSLDEKNCVLLLLAYGLAKY